MIDTLESCLIVNGFVKLLEQSTNLTCGEVEGELSLGQSLGILKGVRMVRTGIVESGKIQD